MARYNPHHDSAAVHAAARHWATLCLAGDRSVFVEHENLWTPSILAELDRLFVQNLDEGEGTFLEKLKGQLQTGSAARSCTHKSDLSSAACSMHCG
jgi:5-methylcytosine-specific restriction enzyme B